MSDEQTNGPETSARRAFRVKLSPGPTEEVIVLAEDAAHAFELIGAKFGGWENIERYEISEIRLIVGNDPKEPSSDRSREIILLRNCLSYIRQVAFGENPHIVPSSIPDYAEEKLQSVVMLRRNYDRRVEEVKRLAKEIETWKLHLEDCRRLAAGELGSLMDCMAGPSKALSAVLALRDKFEALDKRWREATAFKPAPPGPVPSAPPDGPAQIGPGSDDYGTASFEAMTGLGKSAEATDTGDAEEGDENNYMSPEMRQAGFRRLTDPEFARAPDPEEGPEGGEGDGK